MRGGAKLLSRKWVRAEGGVGCGIGEGGKQDASRGTACEEKERVKQGDFIGKRDRRLKERGTTGGGVGRRGGA